MRVLVTGGAGFIGSHVVEAYLERGAAVSIMDDLSTGSVDNIAKFLDHPAYRDKIVFHEETVLNRERVHNIVGGCDTVFHLAAAVGVKYIMENPVTSIRTNIEGTGNILASCAALSKTVLVASSSEVYGKHTHAPLLETDNIIYGPSKKSRWSYAASKLVNEFTALAYARTHGLRVVIVRLFNTIGPKQTGAYGMVVPRFITQALTNEPLSVYGSGGQSRTFVYVKDVVTAMMALIDRKDVSGEIFNVGGTEEITILELARKIIAAAGSQSGIEKIPYGAIFEDNFEDIQRRVPSIKKLQNATGFEPKIGLDTMIRSIIHHVGSK